MNISFALSLVNEWELAGVTDSVISPGSRSTPIAIALGQSEQIKSHVVLDERSAGFLALGISKVTKRPTVVLTTSGTAAANLRPSVSEAFHSGVPLIVVTADRPLELHKVGAAQTMEQEDLFSDVVRFKFSPSVPDVTNRVAWRALASRLFHESCSNPFNAGPVHLNLAFREPLLEVDPRAIIGRPGNRPWYQLHFNGASEIYNKLGSAEKVIVIAGGSGIEDQRLAIDSCLKLGWPVIADVLSKMRLDQSGVITSFEAILRSERIRESVLPDVVVLLGSDLASRTVNDFVSLASRHGARVVRVTNRWFWQDPHFAITDFFFGSHASFFSNINQVNPSDRYLQTWINLDQAAGDEIEKTLGLEFSEPLIASYLYKTANSNDIIFSSSSMPIRDLEWFGPKMSEPATVFSNRGVNGIDGVLSSFLGITEAHNRRYPAGKGYLLVGDLALRHEIGALSNIASSGADLFLLVVDNDGGGIFSFLPQASDVDSELFERFFGTPQGGDLRSIIAGFGIDTYEVDSIDSLKKCFEEFAKSGGVKVILAKTNRSLNVEIHRKVLNGAMKAAEAVLVIGE